MRYLYSKAVWVLLFTLPPAFAQTPAAKKKEEKKPVVSAAKRAKPSPPSSVSARNHHALVSAHAATARRVVVTRKKVNGKWVRSTKIVRTPAPSYQLHPDADRYQKIQQALAERGYFKGEANGEWKDDSVDALKRYQAASNLPNDGKINSLSLIGLGLGPKHDGSITPAPAPPATPQKQ
jgi:hypothetical protein